MPEPVGEPTTERLVSLDAYRGFVMLAMASAGLGLAEVARRFPDSQVWGALERQVQHARWEGCTFWDMIQPSFMFIVGVALPFSYASRSRAGQSWPAQLGHAVRRSLILVALGVFLASAWDDHTRYVFTNVLAQIGLGYSFVFLLVRCRPAVQLAAAFGILIAYWLLFAAYPFHTAGTPRYGLDLNPGEAVFPHLLSHWERHMNAAAAFHRWFLNLFPHPADKPAVDSPEGYTTLNFVPSMATMLFGVLAGGLLRSRQPARVKLQTLLIAGALGVVLGTALGSTVCPIVKRIWSPSWVIYSTGWTCWMLAAFYGVIDMAGYRRWSFPLVVVGANSIAIYLMAQLMKPFIAGTLKTHLSVPWRAFATSASVDQFATRYLGTTLNPAVFGGTYGPVVRSTAVLLVLWLICLWLYRRRIFLKI